MLAFRLSAIISAPDAVLAVQVFHGTTPPSNAHSIARSGPDFSLIGSANGHKYGRGFYTSSNIKVAASYAEGKGAICVCTAALGNVKSGGRRQDTAGALLQQNYHSVVARNNNITVLFHPDAVHVQYIINQVADPAAESALAAKQKQLDALWRDADLVRQKDLQVMRLCIACMHVLCTLGMQAPHSCTVMQPHCRSVTKFSLPSSQVILCNGL